MTNENDTTNTQEETPTTEPKTEVATEATVNEAPAEAAVEATPEVVAPEAAPEVAPEATTEAVPEVTPEVATEVTAETVPEATPEVVPEAAPEVAPEAAVEVAMEAPAVEVATEAPIAKASGDDREKARAGMTIRVHERIKDISPKGEERERVQIFEGMVIMVRGAGNSRSITVRKISYGIGVDKVYPLFSPNVSKIEIIKIAKVRRARLSFLQNLRKRFDRKMKETVVKVVAK